MVEKSVGQTVDMKVVPLAVQMVVLMAAGKAEHWAVAKAVKSAGTMAALWVVSSVGKKAELKAGH